MRRINKEKLGMILLIAFFVIPIFYGIWGAWGMHRMANEKVWDLEKADDWLGRAKASDNLTLRAKYMNESLDLLERFNGNPCWIYPTPETDFNLIKQNIRENRDFALEIQNNVNIDKESYQYQIRNMEKSIEELQENIEGTQIWIYLNPFGFWMMMLFFALLIIIPIGSITLDYLFNVNSFEGGLFWIAGYIGWVIGGAIALFGGLFLIP